MYTEWTKHLKTREEKDIFENKITSAKEVLTRVGELMDERKNSIDSLDLSVKSFDSPNWAYKQAFNNGFRSCLEIVKKYTNLDQQKGNQ